MTAWCLHLQPSFHNRELKLRAREKEPNIASLLPVLRYNIHSIYTLHQVISGSNGGFHRFKLFVVLPGARTIMSRGSCWRPLRPSPAWAGGTNGARDLRCWRWGWVVESMEKAGRKLGEKWNFDDF